MPKSSCIEPDCQSKHYGRGWCKFHYQRAWIAGNHESRPRTLAQPDATPDERLRNIGWSVTPEGCWEWLGSQDGHGYGQLTISGKIRKAHRVAYETWAKTPDAGVDICHRCDNPTCINPKHLFEGTRQQNVDDMVAKGRAAYWNRRPHKLTAAQVADLRAQYATGLFTQNGLAREFGVSRSLVSYIIRNKRRVSRGV